MADRRARRIPRRTARSGCSLRVDNENEELDATVSGTADWSGTEEDGPTGQHDGRNKQRERYTWR